MSAQDNLELARRCYEAYNNNRIDFVASCAAPDALIESVTGGVTFHGPGGLADAARTGRKTFPDGRFEIANQVATAYHVVSELLFTGTRADTGLPVILRVLDIWEMEAGHIARLRNYTIPIIQAQRSRAAA